MVNPLNGCVNDVTRLGAQAWGLGIIDAWRSHLGSV
jgi:hypothetical protein